MRLAGRVAIITGGGRGIGRAIAVAFAQEGADVAVAARTSAEIEETVTQVRASGRKGLAVRADVADRHDVERLVRGTLDAFGRIDILVNDAGVQGPIGLLVDNDVDRWIRTVHVNLVGTFLCMRAVLPHMMERRQGKIINLSGGGAAAPRPHFTAYGASKAAVVRLTETVAEEVKPLNIQVNAIAPGGVNTRMLEQVLAAGVTVGEQALEQVRRQLESGGVPAERAAALAVFLASEESNGLTGRLISAVWDDWETMAERIPAIMATPAFTLRRLKEDGTV